MSLIKQINRATVLPKSSAFGERGKAMKRTKRSDDNMTFGKVKFALTR